MTDRPSPAAALSAFLFVLAFMALYSMLAYFSRSFSALVSASPIVTTALLTVFSFSVPTLIYYEIHRPLRPALRLRPLPLASCALILAASVVGLLAVNGITLFWQEVLSAFGLTAAGQSIAPAKNAPDVLLMFLSMAVVPAVFEELFFRGFLLPSLEPLGQRRAVGLSALIFALLHARVEALPAHLLLGVCLGVLALKTGSLLAPILLHGGYNGAIVLIQLLLSSGGNGGGEAESTATGIPIFFFPFVLVTLLLFLLLLRAAMLQARKGRVPPLPAPPRKRLTWPARVLLCATLLLLFAMQFLSLAVMLAPRRIPL